MQLLTVRDTAASLKVSGSLVYQLVAAGKLPCYRIGTGRGAIRIRSDVERKRLAGLDTLAQSNSGVGQSLYAADATRLTYAHLAQLAGGLLDAGWPVIVDGTFTARWQRDLLREQAQLHGVPFHILDFEVPVATLRERIVKREHSGRDASEAGLHVLQHQIDTEEPLTAEEQEKAMHINMLNHR